MKLKVCGMRETENIAALSNLKPDYMGFIFWASSSRYVNKMTPQLPPSIKKTGVFVNASLNYIQDCVEAHHLQTVQLHGEETPAHCALAKQLGLEIIKAFSIEENFDFNQLTPYEESVDFFLFDTKGALPGGNGYAFDWNVLNSYSSNKPFFLSGGIGLADVTKIKQLSNTNLPLYAIDVNSKFETAPGLKNIEMLTQFKQEII